MWKNTFCLLIIILVPVSCSPLRTVTLTSQPAPRETNTIIIPTNLPLTVTPMSANPLFTKIDLSHQNKQAFSELLDFHLLIKMPENKIGDFNLSKMEIQNERLLSDSDISNPVTSDNGVSLAQIVSRDGRNFLQVKNLLTAKEISIALPDEAILPTWLESKEVAVWGGSSHTQCERLLLIYDTSTAEVTYPIHPMPDLQRSQCLQLPFLTSDSTKTIYPWQMFDFQTGTSKNVFAFMKDVPESPPAYSLKQAGENISIVYANGDKLNYLLNIPISEIDKINLTPGRMLLPGLGTKDGWWQPMTWIPGRMQIGIDLIDQNIDLGKLIASGQQVPTRFYLIDFSEHKVFNFDLDRAVFVEGSPSQTVRMGFPSPDGKYFAWTIYDSASGLYIGSKVLEMSSGFVVSIPQIEVLGWVASTAK